MENDLFCSLQNWYLAQCDGDWEHEYGIKIETVDNSGWYISINLIGTDCDNHPFSPIQMEIDEMNWYFCLVRNNNFEGSCGPCNLAEILQIFRKWAESCQKEGCLKKRFDLIRAIQWNRDMVQMTIIINTTQIQQENMINI